mmetsp:Transcript_27794/g.54610  ORF Transcript_27794/g.54610 Transcript_27794/m.54610 type:complete len:229 (+) Transcript_27794:44-730(+)
MGCGASASSKQEDEDSEDDDCERCLVEELEEVPEKVYKMYHGTSMTSARQIEAEGFSPSTEGELGPGVYFVDEDNVDKARRFAHDEFHRTKDTTRATASNEPALLECEVRLRRFYKVEGVDREGSWANQGFDAAFTEETELSQSTEWCVADPSRITVLSVLDLQGLGCPWGKYCPYLGENSKVEGAPWGGRCPCQPKGPICKRPDCGRPTWNGEENEYCGRTCRNRDG